MSESRKKKLSMLTQSIAKGDFAKAQELLRTHGHTGVNRHGPRPQRTTPGDAEEIRFAGSFWSSRDTRT